MKKIRLLGLILSLTIGALGSLTACQGGPKLNNYVKDCRLHSSYSAKENTFLDNGIGEVTLKQNVDGDTAHFYQKEVNPSIKSRVVKVRFLGVDTPESTGKIEPWGKKASKFTSSKLLSAKTIVLTVDVANIGKPAEFDSTGTRYVGFVWVSDKENCPQNKLDLLNLWIVQEGWSNAKNITDSELSTYFIDADMQAQNKKVGQWQGNDPDYYQGKANETTIKVIMDSFLDEGDESPWIDSKVAVTGVVYKVVGTDCYLNGWFKDEVTGEMQQYGLYVFAGYANYKPLKSLGALIRVVGTFQNHYGSPQITNVKYDSLHPSDDNMSIIEPVATEGTNIPVVKGTDIVGHMEKLNCIVQMKDLVPYGGYNEVDATTHVPSGAFNIYVKDASGAELAIRVPKEVWALDESEKRVTDYNYYVNLYKGNSSKTLNMLGAFTIFESTTSDRITYQLKLCNKADLTINQTI